jgi:hypothetical protein
VCTSLCFDFGWGSYIESGKTFEIPLRSFLGLNVSRQGHKNVGVRRVSLNILSSTGYRRWPERPRVRRSDGQESKTIKSSGAGRGHTVVPTIVDRKGLGFSSCAAPFTTPGAQFQNGGPKENARGVGTILVDLQTELQLQYRALFIVVYKLKEVVR